jgi:hypothetical protein
MRWSRSLRLWLIRPLLDRTVWDLQLELRR